MKEDLNRHIPQKFWCSFAVSFRACLLVLTVGYVLHGKTNKQKQSRFAHKNLIQPHKTTAWLVSRLSITEASGEYFPWWSIRRVPPPLPPRKGYRRFQASGIWKGRNFTYWSVWKDTVISHQSIFTVKVPTRANAGIFLHCRKIL